MRGTARFAERLLDSREGVAVVIVAIHITEERQETMKCPLVIDSAGLLEAVRYSLLQPFECPLGKRNADDRNIEGPAFDHRI